MLSPAMLAELARVWAVLDESCDGRVDTTELHSIFAKLMHAKIPTSMLDALMKKLDKDSDGFISWEEFREHFVSSATSTHAPRVHGLVHDLMFGGSRHGPPLTGGAPDLRRAASSFSVDTLRAAKSATDHDSRNQHAECWTFLGGDGPFIELTIKGMLDLDINAEAADVLKKLTEAINFFDPASEDVGVRKAIAVLVTAIQTNAYSTDALKEMKNLVKHIGVIALFSSPEQRYASYHRIVRLFDLAVAMNLGELFLQVLKAAIPAIEIGGAIGGEVHQILLFAALGAFFFFGGPRLPHLPDEDKWQAGKAHALVETCRFGGQDAGSRLLEVCQLAGRYVAFAEGQWRTDPNRFQHILTSLLFLGTLSSVNRISTPSGAEYALPVYIAYQQRRLLHNGLDDERSPFDEVKGFFAAARNLQFGEFSVPIQRAASAYFAIAMGFSHEVCPGHIEGECFAILPQFSFAPPAYLGPACVANVQRALAQSATSIIAFADTSSSPSRLPLLCLMIRL